MRGWHWACRILAAGHQVGLRSAGQTAEHWALLRLWGHERGTQQGDKATHACWVHSDSCYFRSVSTLRQVHCQANTVLGFCPTVPSPALLTRMTCSGTGESISVHSPAVLSHKKHTNQPLPEVPAASWRPAISPWKGSFVTALHKRWPKGLCLKVNHLIFLLCLKGCPCMKTNSQFVLTATRVRNSDSAMMDLSLYVPAKTSEVVTLTNEASRVVFTMTCT